MATFLTRLLDLTPMTPEPAFEGRIVLGLWSGLVAYGGIAAMEGTREPRILIDDTVGYPVLSPDTQTILYLDSRRACPPDSLGPDDCYYRLFTLPFKGGDEEQMTPNGLMPERYSWLPNSNTIGLSVEQPADANQVDWYLATIVTPLVVERLGDLANSLYGAEWSVTGDIAASSDLESGHTVVLVLDADGSAKAAIAVTGKNVHEPHWSPDGSHLSYIISDDDGVELVVSNPDGSDRTVVGTAESIRSVAWSPDGTRIAYIAVLPSPEPSTRTLIVSDSKGNQHTLARDLWDFAWSPDGTAIGCILDGKAWAVRIDGSQRWRLAPSGTIVSTIDWGMAP